MQPAPSESLAEKAAVEREVGDHVMIFSLKRREI